MEDQLLKLLDATSNDDVKTLKRLTKETDATLLKDEGWRIAHAAAKTGNLSIIRYIAKKEPSVLDKKNEVGEGVVHIAARGGHLRVVQYVEEQRPSTFQADVGAVAEIASQNDHFDIVIYLARKHDSVLHHQFRDNNTVIHLAVEKNLTDVETLEFLVKQKGISLSEYTKNGNGDSLIHIAARNGNVDFIRYMVKKNPQILIEDDIIEASSQPTLQYIVQEQYKVVRSKDEYLIRLAARKKYWDVIRYMIEKHPSAFNRAELRFWPFPCPPVCEVAKLAVGEGLLDLTQKLVEKFEEVAEHLDPSGTIAHIAAGAGHTHILKYLAKNCPKLFVYPQPDESIAWIKKRVNWDGDYVMHVVAEKNSTSVEDFQFLVENAGSVTLIQENEQKKTRVVDIVASKGNLDVIQYITERVDPPVLHYEYEPQILARLAIQNGHDNILWYMARRSPSMLTHIPKQYFRQDFPDLHGGFNMIELVIQGGILDENKLKMLVETDGLRFLLEDKECAREIARVAIRKKKESMVQYMALKCPSVFEETSHNQTIFNLAVRENVMDVETTKCLIDKKGLPLLETSDQRLSFAKKAATNGNIRLIEYVEGKSPGFLLENTNILFQIPNDIDIVSMVYQIEEKDLHGNASSQIGREFECKVVHMAVHYGRKTFLEHYLNKNKVSDVNMKNYRSETPIFTAVRSRHFNINIFKFLVEERNADLEALSLDKSNILFPIAERNDLQLMIYILDERKAPIDINWQNDSGDTLLHKISSQREGIKMLKYLVEQKKADVTLRNCAGKTPLHCAASLPTNLISNYLINNGADPKIQDKSGHSFYEIYYHSSGRSRTRVRRSVSFPHPIDEPYRTRRELDQQQLGMSGISVVNETRSVFSAQPLTFLMVAGSIFGKFIGGQILPTELILEEEINSQIAVRTVFDRDNYSYNEDAPQ